MEKYKLNGNGSIISITQGRYYNKIFSKHVINYGETGAHNIRDNILSTFREALLQFRSPAICPMCLSVSM